MKVSTTGYPPLFYKNEQLTIECKATEYTQLVLLQIRDRVKSDQHGCTYIASHSPTNALLRPAFPDLTEEICESSLRPTTPPSTLRVTGTVTDDLIGLQLYCYASGDGVEVDDGNLAVDTTRGRLLKLANVILQFICFRKVGKYFLNYCHVSLGPVSV